MLNLVSVFRLRQIRAISSPLVPLKQIPRVHLVGHVRELVAPAVGDDHVAAGLEGLQVVGHLGAEELRRVQRGLVDHHGHALGLHALHDALDGARAEVVGVGLHRQAAHTHKRLRLALIDDLPHNLNLKYFLIIGNNESTEPLPENPQLL